MTNSYTKHKIAKNHVVEVIIFLAFFISTMSYSRFFSLGILKYVSIAATIAIFLYRSRGIFDREKFKIATIIVLILTFFTAFQDTTLSQKATSFFFYVVLVTWLFFGNQIFENRMDVWAGVLGVLSAQGYVIITTWGLRAQQLALISNTRHRVYWGFMHPNFLASFSEGIILAVIVLYVLDATRKSHIKQLAYGMLIVISFYLIMVSGSRTALISVGMFLIFLTLGVARERLRKWSVVGMIFIVIGSVFAFIRVYQSYLSEDTSFVSRFNAGLMKVTARTMIVGNGMVSQAELNLENLNGTHGEVALVSLFYKNGLIGIVAYVAIFGFIFYSISLIKDARRKMIVKSLVFSVLIGSFGEPFIVNITNVFPMMIFLLISCLTFGNSSSLRQCEILPDFLDSTKSGEPMSQGRG